MTGKWDDPAFPKRGWVNVDTYDLGEPSEVCEMCETREIRYVHVMEHPTGGHLLRCGCICAGKMELNPDAAKARERCMKLHAARLKREESRQAKRRAAQERERLSREQWERERQERERAIQEQLERERPARERQHFFDYGWKASTSTANTIWRHWAGLTLSIFPNKFGSGFAFCISGGGDERIFKRGYASVEAAKEVLWDVFSQLKDDAA